MKTILLAVGGNALIRAGEKGTIAEQIANARRTALEIAGLIRDGYRIVLTHGNGPQVGAALLRSERGASQVPGHPLDVCDASSQGEIGYILQQSLETELRLAGLRVPVVTVVTQSVVSPDDPAMKHPSKPIGPFYSLADAEEKKRQFGWQIVELEVIQDLVQRGVLVIACGGGGIPVTWQDGGMVGVEAVIDKDRASALLASRLGVDSFVISTDTDYVYLDYKKPTQRPLLSVEAGELASHYADGHFPAGNMGPKIESVLRFLKNGGKEAIITSGNYLRKALGGEGGTHILPDRSQPILETQTAVIAGDRR